MNKHTPGPWEVKPEEVGKSYIRIRGSCLGRRFKIANVIHPDHEGFTADDVKETRANAHLIAAAPDLYKELELARFTIAMEIATMGPRTLDREEKESLITEHPAIKSIDATLAKARGES